MTASQDVFDDGALPEFEAVLHNENYGLNEKPSVVLRLYDLIGGISVFQVHLSDDRVLMPGVIGFCHDDGFHNLIVAVSSSQSVNLSILANLAWSRASSLDIPAFR